MAGGLRYETGRDMPPGMQVLYGAKLTADIRVVKSTDETAPVAAEPELLRYCGKGPEREDLPECPFCGGDNLLVDRDSEGWYLECNSCLAEGPRAETQAEAERKWCNRT